MMRHCSLSATHAKHAEIDAHVLRVLGHRDLDSSEIRREVPRYRPDVVGYSIDRLAERELIRDTSRRGKIKVWHLTDAGRAALPRKAA